MPNTNREKKNVGKKNASQNRPSSSDEAPDPASSYGRERPEKEAGMGRLDNDVATPTDRPDRAHHAVKNRQDPQRIDQDDSVTQAHEEQAEPEDLAVRPRMADPDRMSPPTDQPDHSMKEEEPLGWDQAPVGKKPKRDQRQPKTRGTGGV